MMPGDSLRDLARTVRKHIKPKWRLVLRSWRYGGALLASDIEWNGVWGRLADTCDAAAERLDHDSVWNCLEETRRWIEQLETGAEQAEAKP